MTAEQIVLGTHLCNRSCSAKIVKGCVSIALQNLKGRSKTPKKFYSIVSWKTQNQQNNTEQNGNLVAPKRSSASTTFPVGDASIKPKHLSFLIGGTGKNSNGNLNTVIEGWRCHKPGSHPLKL